MPKLKSKKGVMKRFKRSKTGKIKYYAGGKSHLATNKKTKRIRSLRRAKTIDGAPEKKYLRRMMPYA
ncbi:MAG: 50S ribosomal protein L35 [Candidatus Omnitrophica bacterium]|jgi:large subunit ribosomal protein L35|nr:50S ribosomal protein L35 [Candidatus Omnitrophota bacterium]